MKINTNVSALNTQRQLGIVGNRLADTMEKLSSGLRIAGAEDDAAGLASSEKLRGEIAEIDSYISSGENAISGLQTADSALEEVQGLLDRAKELVTSKESYAAGSDEVAAIEQELTQIGNEVDNILGNTEYQSTKLLDGNGSFTIFSGIGGNASGLTISDTTSVSITAASDGIAEIDADIKAISTSRGQIGSYMNRFEASIKNYEALDENLTAAESTIRDADIDEEMVKFTKDSIIQQAAQAMVTQANQLPSGIVSLLQ